METFWIKPKLYFGPEPMAALDQLAGKRVLIVTDAFLASSGLLDRVKNRLTGAVEIFDQVEPDPSLRLVAQGVRMLRDFGPDAVVAFGGGSPMDCAKGMCWFSDRHPPLWCIPTTAGTGSEVTSFAVLTDTDQGVKYPLVEEDLLPEAAILDASLLEGVPPHVTADTGMDVLTHAAEAVAAKGASPFSDALAEKAFALAYRRLPEAHAGSREAKQDMLLASCMAGMAFNAARLGEGRALSGLFLLGALSCGLLAVTGSPVLSVAGILALRLSASVFAPIGMEVQNRQVRSCGRATMLSVYSSVMNLVAVGTGLIFGRLAEEGVGRAMAAGAGFCLAGLLLYTLWRRLPERTAG